MLQHRGPIRGFLFDCARTLERPGYYENAFKFLAERGINRVIWHFCDDQGCQLQFRCLPEIGSPNAFTVSETRRLVHFAKRCGIVLVPEVAALGHSRYITRLPQYQHLNEDDSSPYSGMCPVHPQTREVIAALVRETIEVFDSPEVHVGLDEVEIGKNPLTRTALQTRSADEIIADHIRFLHSLVVTEGGREMWMWADGLVKSPDLLGMIPKDIVACNWQYRPTAGPSSTQLLLDAGFDVITASALLSHDETLFPSNDYAMRNVRALRSHRELISASTPAQVRGEIITTWIPCRSLSEAQWIGWHLAIQINSAQASSEQEAVIRGFGQEFHGIDQTDYWLNACRTLVDHAPERPEWMAVIKLDLENLPAELAGTIAEKALRWQAAVLSLRRCSSKVRSNVVAYDALSLLIELLAHAYVAAARLWEEPPCDLVTIGVLLKQRRELIEQLDAAWDRERFADDPAKFQPVVRFFRDDHLLLIVRDGLTVLQERSARAPIERPFVGKTQLARGESQWKP